jgi:hypothetical protein
LRVEQPLPFGPAVDVHPNLDEVFGWPRDFRRKHTQLQMHRVKLVKQDRVELKRAELLRIRNSVVPVQSDATLASVGRLKCAAQVRKPKLAAG